MNPDRQTAHNTHPTTHRFGGQLVSARAEDEPTFQPWFSRSIGHSIGSVRRVVRASSPGLWWCSEDGTDRPWKVSSAASNQPPRTPKARGARPCRSSPWQPTSWGGKTTYRTTHKTDGVYRPGQGAGTPPDTPQRTPLQPPFGGWFPHPGSVPIDHLCCQLHIEQTSSGLCRSSCIGLSIPSMASIRVPLFIMVFPKFKFSSLRAAWSWILAGLINQLRKTRMAWSWILAYSGRSWLQNAPILSRTPQLCQQQMQRFLKNC